MAFFNGLIYTEFTLLIVAVVAIQLSSKHGSLFLTTKNEHFASFQRKYLTVFLAVMMAEWLQGPYLYRLYEHHGFLESQIAALYITGFVSAALLGPYLGGMADWHGARRMCLVFCGVYSLSCLLKLFNSFFLLMFGRVLDGVATSLLFSAFETWMIQTHKKIDFPAEWLRRTFSLTTVGNSLIAAAAGVLANILAEWNGHHPVRPFLASVLFLVIAAATIWKTWEETNVRGGNGQDAAPKAINNNNAVKPKRSTAIGGLRLLLLDQKTLYLALIQALFEAPMYIFAFWWTTTLDPKHVEGHPPLGFIFGSYMMAILAGSVLFRRLAQEGWTVTRIMNLALACAMVCMLLTSLINSLPLLFTVFVLYEGACGLYFPAIGTLRGELVPESHRAAIMGWARVPLNFIVVAFLLLVGVISRRQIFALCALLCFAACLCQRKLAVLVCEHIAKLPQTTTAFATKGGPSTSSPVAKPCSTATGSTTGSSADTSVAISGAKSAISTSAVASL